MGFCVVILACRVDCECGWNHFPPHPFSFRVNVVVWVLVVGLNSRKGNLSTMSSWAFGVVSSYRKKIWISILLLSDVNGGISTGQAGHCAVHDALSVHASFIRRLYIDSCTVQVHFPRRGTALQNFLSSSQNGSTWLHLGRTIQVALCMLYQIPSIAG